VNGILVQIEISKVESCRMITCCVKMWCSTMFRGGREPSLLAFSSVPVIRIVRFGYVVVRNRVLISFRFCDYMGLVWILLYNGLGLVLFLT